MYNELRVTKLSRYTNIIYTIIQQSNIKREIQNYTIEEWFEKYLSEYCSSIKDSTFASYKQAVNNHIVRILRDIQLKHINSEVIQFFILTLSKGDEDSEPLSPKSVKNVYGVLHKGLLIAYKLRYMSSNIEDMVVNLPKVTPTRILPLTNDEISSLLSYINGSRYQLIIKTAIFSGMRESELLGLRWSDIDFNSGTIHISQQLVRDKITHEFRLTSLKNDKPRSIKPASFLMRDLEVSFTGNRNDFVFTNPDTGNHMTHNSVYRYLKKAASRSFGRDNVRFHDLRHTYAVLSLQAGDDYKTLQENMGHFSAAFTLDRYGHCTDSMKVISSQRMDSYYNNVFC